jgi:NAD(P)H dehydrogenase (quinone)
MKSICFAIILLSFGFIDAAGQSVRVLIAYHSETGNTEAMANAVAVGARSVDEVIVTLKPLCEVKMEDLTNADAIIVGSPVYNANVSPEISAFIASWPFEGEPLKDKIGAAFVTAGGMSAGEEIVQMNILQSMLVFGMVVVGGSDWKQPFGASSVTSEEPFSTAKPGEMDDLFLRKGHLLGTRVAEIAVQFNKSGAMKP